MPEFFHTEDPEDPPYVGKLPDFENPTELDECPIHSRVAEHDGDQYWGWPCPVAVEGDPPESPTCGYFAEMLTYRTKHAQNHYFRIFFSGEDDYPGVPGENRHYTQEFINGEAVGPPTLMFDDEPFEGYTQENSSKCVVCQIPCFLCTWEEDCDHDGDCVADEADLPEDYYDEDIDES